MPSALMRRSGIASVHISKLIGWRPKTIIQAGIGLHWEEVDCIREQWPDVEFYGVEPNPYLLKKLEGKYPGKYYDCAVGDTVETAILYFRRRHKDGSSLNRLWDKEDEPTKEVIVQVVTFDKLFPNIEDFSKPILLWLDCEGNELKALHGGRKLIKHIDMINVEMTGKPPGEGWCKPQEVHDLLTGVGFRIQYVHTFRTSQGQYDAVYVKSHLFKSEYCSFPCRCSR